MKEAVWVVALQNAFWNRKSYREPVCSAVGIATGYGLNDWEVGVQVPVGYNFSLIRIIHTGSEAHWTSDEMVPGAFYPGIKQPEHEVSNLPVASAEVKKVWVYTCTSFHVFIVVVN
jgi:hypothetical protein